ncbi:MAG: MoaD/ThiS family protein [Planctomycetota bacterium]|mgnify:CR=1 FL=1|nr:MoaD/ThiS family protein [Planctomycetota bacterium]
MATVFIPAQLRELSSGIQSVELEAKNVREIVNQLDTMFPGFKDRVCTDGNISPTLQVSIDSVMTSRGMIAKVQPQSEVHFIPAIGGG